MALISGVQVSVIDESSHTQNLLLMLFVASNKTKQTRQGQVQQEVQQRQMPVYLFNYIQRDLSTRSEIHFQTDASNNP